MHTSLSIKSGGPLLSALLSVVMFSLTLVYAPLAAAQSACPANGESFCKQTTSCLGLNTGSFGYGSLDKPFIDLMKGAGIAVQGYDPDSISKNPDIPLDRYQYPRVVGRTISVVFYTNSTATFTTNMLRSGRYVIMWEGSGSNFAVNGPGVSLVSNEDGRLEFELNSRVVGNSFLTYVNDDAADNVRNMRIVPIAYEDDYKNWNWAQYRIGAATNPPIFFPEWVKKMSNACTIRYVNSRAINDPDAVTFARDSIKTMVDPASSVWYDGFGLGADTTVAHVWPWDLIVEATRVTNTRPWINFKVMAYENHFAGNRIIERVAKMFERYYGGAIYVEYGNEIWNFAYPFNVASTHVRLNGPGSSDNLPENYSLRNNLIQRVFAENYGDNACLAIGVLASQGRFPGLGAQMMAFADTDYVDLLSPTTYVGDNLEPGNLVWNFVEDLYTSVQSGAISEDQAFSRLRIEVLTGSENKIVRNWRSDVGPFTQEYINMADNAQICSGFYEAGLHMRVDGVDVSNPVHVGVRQFMRDYQVSRHQAAVEKEVFDYVSARSTGPNLLFASFDNSGGGTFSYWDSVFESAANRAPRTQLLFDSGDGGGTGVVNKAAIDGIEYELKRIERRIRRAPARVFRDSANRQQLLNLAKSIRRATTLGLDGRLKRLRRQMLAKVNGCGGRADADDYIVNCGIQRRVQRHLTAIRPWIAKL